MGEEPHGADRLQPLKLFTRRLGWQWRMLRASPVWQRLARRLGGWRRILVFLREPDALVIRLAPTMAAAQEGAGVELARFALPADDTDASAWRGLLADALRKIDTAVDRVVLALAPALVIRRRFTLPAAALADLEEAVALDIDRITPLPAEKVVFAVQPMLARESQGEIPVEVAAAPAHYLHPILDALRALQTPVDEILLGGLARPGADRPGLAWTRLIPTGAALAGLVLAWVIINWPVNTLQAEIASARARLAEVMPQARAAAETRQALLAQADAVAWLKKRRRSRPTALALLDETARLLPEDAFLLQWSLEEERVGLIGYGREAARLIAVFDQAQLVEKPRFTSALTSDARLGRERFSLELSLRAHSAQNAAEAQEETREGGP